MNVVENSEQKIYEWLVRILGACKRESEKGKYYMFSKDDVVTENVSLGGNKTAKNVEEELQSLGKAVYAVLTGKSEDNKSIQLDGYMWIDVFFWPVLQVLLLEENPTIEKVEKSIEKLEKDIADKEQEEAKKAAVAIEQSENESPKKEEVVEQTEKEIILHDEQKAEDEPDKAHSSSEKNTLEKISLPGVVLTVAALAIAISVLGVYLVLKAYLVIGAVLVSICLVGDKDVREEIKEDVLFGLIAAAIVSVLWGLAFCIKHHKN